MTQGTDWTGKNDAGTGRVKELDDWDVESSESDFSCSLDPHQFQPTVDGERLKDAFLKKQDSHAYKKMIALRKSLPMYQYRQQILDIVKDEPVTILCAETGAGKTTQCPQFLLEEALSSGFGDSTSIICTQPRRISAVTVAERVAEEFGEEVGGHVGYQIRMETKKSNKTKLLFCTTGVILRRLQDDPNLRGVTHILVDEVHERQWQIDFLLIALRRLLNTTRRDLKVVLMSATLDSKLFVQFFNGAPLLSVPGRTFPVSEYFLEDIIEATKHIIEEGSRCAYNDYYDEKKTSLWVTTRGGEKRKEVVSLESDSHPHQVSDNYQDYSMSTRRSMDRVDETVINYDLIEDLLTLLLVKENTLIIPPQCDQGTLDLSSGSVLIFLPGLGEIRALNERLKSNRILGSDRFDIIPMHSTLSSKDQKRAFLKPRHSCQKIILATNIAETSVTIADCVCVIDSGLVREARQKTDSNVSSLVTDWTSKASSKQRSGRAGRVQPGICCKLYSSHTAQYVMQSQSMPELRRVPLEEVCLNILAGGLSSNCASFLEQAPQPPSDEAIHTALKTLEEVGAVKRVFSDTHIDSLTSLGKHLAKIPVQVYLGKMLLYGSLFKVLDKVLTIAASLSTKSPFRTNIDDQQQASSVHASFKHPTSDFFTVCNVWDGYCAAKKISSSNANKFCTKNFLSIKALREIGEMRQHFVDSLDQIGFVDKKKIKFFDVARSQFNDNGANEDVVSAIICAGFYPNVAHACTESNGSTVSLFHKSQQVHFHKSSVNYNKKLKYEWIAFHERFETSKTFVSATCTIRPFSLLLFGGGIDIDYLARKATVDGWIELNIAAQTGIMFREIRHQLELLLDGIMEHKKCDDIPKSTTLIENTVKLLSCE